jgi:glycosyltransferase involved in cell wall biosynthesis
MGINTSPILSITIPTYNRAQYLKENLEAILKQITDYASKIEIIVNDNASTDNTSSVITDLAEKYKFPIQYHRKDKNVCFKDNFADVTSKATGKYLFLLGDDDILSPDFFKIIFPYLLSKENLAIIHFNRLSGNAQCSMNQLHDWVYDGATNIYDYKEFWLRVMSSPNFMSSIIIRRDCFIKGKAFAQINHYGYEWFAQACFGSIGEKCLYYYFPLILMRNPPRAWGKEGSLYFFVGMTNLFKDLDKFIPGVNKAWMFRQKHTHFYDFYASLPYITKYKDINKPHIGEFMKAMPKTSDKLLLYILFFCSYFLPYKAYTKLYYTILNLYRIITSEYKLRRKTLY